MKLGSQSPSKFLLCQPEHMASIPEVTRWLLNTQPAICARRRRSRGKGRRPKGSDFHLHPAAWEERLLAGTFLP